MYLYDSMYIYISLSLCIYIYLYMSICNISYNVFKFSLRSYAQAMKCISKGFILKTGMQDSVITATWQHLRIPPDHTGPRNHWYIRSVALQICRGEEYSVHDQLEFHHQAEREWILLWWSTGDGWFLVSFPVTPFRMTRAWRLNILEPPRSSCGKDYRTPLVTPCPCKCSGCPHCL